MGLIVLAMGVQLRLLDASVRQLNPHSRAKRLGRADEWLEPLQPFPLLGLEVEPCNANKKYRRDTADRETPIKAPVATIATRTHGRLPHSGSTIPSNAS